MIIKQSIHQENITNLNIYVSSNNDLKIPKQKVTALKRETHKFTIIVGDFTSPMTKTYRTSPGRVAQ